MKFYTEEWSDLDFNKVEKTIKNEFAGKTLYNHRGELRYFPSDFENIDFMLGLPYVSSGMVPMIGLDCNEHFIHPENPGYRYDFVALDENKDVVFVLCDEEENKKVIYPKTKVS